MQRIGTETWVVWIAGVLVATASAVFVLVTFAYGQFETKESAAHKSAAHDKIDALIFQQLTEINRKLDDMSKARPRD